jgi:hypothetical protein
MAEMHFDATKMRFQGEVPLGRFTYPAPQQAANGAWVEQQIVSLDEGSVAFSADPSFHPMAFALNAILAIMRKGGLRTERKATLREGETVGGWTVWTSPVDLLVTYEGGGEVRVTWSPCRFWRNRAGQVDPRFESVQLVGAIVLKSLRKAVTG